MRKFAWMLALFLVAGCAPSAQTPSPNASGKHQVLVSFYPLHQFAAAVAGDLATVSTLIPPGTPPHDFEPGARDMKRLGDADLFIYNGGGMEPWVEKALQSVRPQAVVETTRGLTLRQGMDDDHEDEDDHHHEWDPHIWLDPVLAQHQVNLIYEALVALDPSHQEVYQANRDAYQAQLATLHEAFTTGLASCTRREFITAHASFGYLAERYGLQQIALTGLAAEAEPKPKDLAATVQLVRERGITHIFFESTVSEKLAQVIAKETGAQTLVIHPLEMPVQGKDYLSAMQENLAHLQLALGCP